MQGARLRRKRHFEATRQKLSAKYHKLVKTSGKRGELMRQIISTGKGPNAIGP